MTSTSALRPKREVHRLAPVPAPTPVIDIARGIAALEEDLPRVLRALDKCSLEELGWTRPNKTTLLIPMEGTANGVTDQFLLRLGFAAYSKWPPSAQFVNPETLAYFHPTDQHHVPRLTSPECCTHAKYQAGNGRQMQLICCSATLEFYEMAHPVEPEHLWNEKNTFYTTVQAIQKAIASSYMGRFPKL